ncbi:cellulase family glycosylhydrolase, partial [bacterium]|nr:cellulase family glycosylhydrolase [bacterium]
DREVTKLGSGQGRRIYTLPPAAVAFGAENVLAFRVEARGESRGIRQTTEMRCSGLEGDAGQRTPPVDVLATPLSPCVVLTPQTDKLHIHHAGKARLLVPGSARPIVEAAEIVNGGWTNWVLLWLRAPTPAAVQRPILLVFQHAPKRIVPKDGITEVTLGTARQRVIAVRPWVKFPPVLPWSMDVSRKCDFWSRAALAVPVNYMNVTQVLKPGEPLQGISIDRVPRGPVLQQTIAYDYLETKDDWGTKPLKLAPLPALCSFALDCGFRTLKVDQKVETVQDGGLLAPYRAVTARDKVSYSYAVEPWPRLAGFTSWMFSPVDTGVLGNAREVELLADTGANSFRPQHNFSDEPPPKHLDPGGGRNRVQIITDYTNDAGMNYMNNIDQTLGGTREYVREHYDEFMEKVNKHYETIAGLLHSKPFWAVTYDLINEPFDHHHTRYNPAMKALTRRVRAIDRTHLLCIEPCEAWGAIQQLRLIEPTGDPLTIYSFHDYNFRLKTADERWPSLESDISTITRMWLPAIEFQIRHGVCMHCGEFGGHHRPTDDSLAQYLLQNDFFRIFDQFGMHHHYYTGREVYQRLADGSVRASNVVRAYRAYFTRRDFNRFYPRWKGQPAAPLHGNRPSRLRGRGNDSSQ